MVNPLHMALMDNNMVKARQLITKGADIHTVNKRGATPLQEAARRGLIDISKMLIRNGADINTVDKNKRTPLHDSSFQGHVAVVELLMKKGSNINAVDKDGQTPLHHASFGGHVDVADLLIRKKAQVDAVDEQENTPLHLASTNGYIGIVEILLKKEADVDSVNESGQTPLYNASVAGHTAIMTLLIEHGADIGDIALYSIIENRENQDARRRRDVLQVLVKNGVDINAIRSEDYYTSLHCAINSKDSSLAKFLIENGANVNSINKEGLSVLQWILSLFESTGYICYTTVELLIDMGADTDFIDRNGDTLLHHLSRSKEFGLSYAQILIDKGVNVNVANKKMKTPLHDAIAVNNKIFVELLLENGANIHELHLEANQFFDIENILIEHMNKQKTTDKEADADADSSDAETVDEDDDNSDNDIPEDHIIEGRGMMCRQGKVEEDVGNAIALVFGGRTHVPCYFGEADVVTKYEVIEVKKAVAYKAGIGQLAAYLADEKFTGKRGRLHLFSSYDAELERCVKKAKVVCQKYGWEVTGSLVNVGLNHY